MKKKNLFFWFLLLLIAPTLLKAQKPLATLEFVSIHPTPVLGKGYKGAEDVKFGFEAGTVRKVNGMYYLFITEVVDTPKTAAVRIALWKSADGLQFEKVRIITQTNYNWNDTVSHKMSPWQPNAVFDPERNLWSIFHVGYKRKPNSTNVFNMTGRIFRYDSEVSGIEGISGPYKEGGWLDIDKTPDWWEGPGEIVSFGPFKVGNEWWAFYGGNSVPTHVSSTVNNPNAKNIFYAGLAKAESGLTSKWVRQSKLNPVLMDPEFIENSVVTQVSPDLYINVYDGNNSSEISYACSKNGINWEKEQLVKIKNLPALIKHVRTPLCLIDEGKGIYTIYFTAFDGNNPEKVEPLWHDGFGNVWKMQVKLKRFK